MCGVNFDLTNEYKPAGFMFYVQRGLSKVQAIPVIGSFPVSPVKAAVSLLQAAVALIATGIFQLIAYAFESEGAQKIADKAWKNFELGLGSAIYAGANFGTFGLLGLYCEYIITRDRS